jgi:hypothetical protein
MNLSVFLSLSASFEFNNWVTLNFKVYIITNQEFYTLYKKTRFNNMFNLNR